MTNTTTTPKTKGQPSTDTSQNASELLAALQAILPYAKNEIGFINLRSGGSKKEEAAAKKATTALAFAEAAIAKAKGLAA